MVTSKTEVHTAEKAQPPILHKRIGSIVYEVEIHFNPSATETFNDKKLRLMRRDMEALS